MKVKHPKGYLDKERDFLDTLFDVTKDERPFEFMMNQLRLHQAFTVEHFQQSTGVSINSILPQLQKAHQQQLMTNQLTSAGEEWQVTKQGQRYLNDLLAIFL